MGKIQIRNWLLVISVWLLGNNLKLLNIRTKDKAGSPKDWKTRIINTKSKIQNIKFRKIEVLRTKFRTKDKAGGPKHWKILDEYKIKNTKYKILENDNITFKHTLLVSLRGGASRRSNPESIETVVFAKPLTVIKSGLFRYHSQ